MQALGNFLVSEIAKKSQLDSFSLIARQFSEDLSHSRRLFIVRYVVRPGGRSGCIARLCDGCLVIGRTRDHPQPT